MADHREEFEQFHTENPGVYEALVRLTRQAIIAGKTRGSINMLFEVVRWEHYLATTDSNSRYRLNNNYRAHYARMLMDKNIDMTGFFSTRESPRVAQ